MSEVTPFFPLFFSLSLIAAVASSSPAIGVTYRHHRGLPSPDLVVSALRSAGITHAHLPSPDPSLLRSFLYSGVSLLLSLPPDPLASNRSAARRWISDHVLPFHPRARIAALSVAVPAASPSILLPAVKNLRAACDDLGLRKIPVLAAVSFSDLRPSLPPSSARFSFKAEPLLDYLSSAGSALVIDLSPFQLIRADPAIPIGYAMFGEEEYREDPGSGLRYRNLFDSMLDAALAASGRRVAVVVVGTGWPTGGAREATLGYARRYNGGLVERLRSGIGTPARREAAAAVYISDLFDDPRGRGEEWERHWGLWWPNLSRKYEIVWSSGSGGRAGFWGSGFWFGSHELGVFLSPLIVLDKKPAHKTVWLSVTQD